jgi:hypothetical protein
VTYENFDAALAPVESELSRLPDEAGRYLALVRLHAEAWLSQDDEAVVADVFARAEPLLVPAEPLVPTEPLVPAEPTIPVAAE